MKSAAIILALILLLGTFLRLHDIVSESLDFDEKITQGVIQKDIPALIANRHANYYPPVYFIIMRAWAAVFGISPLALRIPSALFGVLSIFFLYKFLKDYIAAGDIPIMVSFLLAISPYHIYFSNEARPYTFTLLLAILANIAFFKACACGKTGFYIAYTAVMITALYTYYGMVLFLAAHIVYAVFTKRFPAAVKMRLYACFVIAAAAIMLWLPSPLKGDPSNPLIEYVSLGPHWQVMRYVRNFLMTVPVFASRAPLFLDSPFRGILRLGYDTSVLLEFLYRGALIFIFAAGLVCVWRRRENNGGMRDPLFITLWLFIPPLLLFALSCLFTPCYVAKYTAFSMPAFFVVLSAAIVWLNKTWIKMSVFIVLTAVSLISILNYYSLDVRGMEKPRYMLEYFTR